MSSVLGKFVKQPSEVLDYDVDFSDWFADRTDTFSSFEVTVPTGITLVASARTGNVVKVVLGGGTTGGRYQITVKVTTAPTALVREADFVVVVKEV